MTTTPTPHSARVPQPPQLARLGLTGGRLLCAGQDARGDAVTVPLFGPAGTGTVPGLITGIPGSGKTNTTAAVILPGVLAGAEIVLCADGRGRPGQDPAVRAYTRTAARLPQWAAMIEMVHQVMDARTTCAIAQASGGTGGPVLGRPLITLLLSEALSIGRALAPEHVRMVADIAAQGGPVGIRLLQVTMTPAAGHVIGGQPVRDLITSTGWAVHHRGMAGSQVHLGGQAQGIRLDALRTGQAAVIVAGRQVVQAQHRPVTIGYLPDGRARDVLAQHTPAELTGPDLAAAGPAYTTLAA